GCGHRVGDLDVDVGADAERCSHAHREVAQEDVAEVGRGLRAHAVQGDALATGEAARLDIDVPEAEVVVGGPGQVLHVEGRDEQGQVEGVADQVAGVQHRVGVDHHLGSPGAGDGEGGAAGLEVPAPTDHDLC